MSHSNDQLRQLERFRSGPDFFSRKNKVFRSSQSGRPVVVKVFGVGRREIASKEFSVLQRCSGAGLSTPSPIGLISDSIVMEYLEGVTVAALLDTDASSAKSSSVAGFDRIELSRSLGEWIAGFHGLFDFKLSRGDANMRNSIVVGGTVYGIDFEECLETDVLIDLGQMCSSVLSMHPMFTEEKFEFVRAMSERYFQSTGQDRRQDLPSSTARALRHYARFRTDGDEMSSWADRIEDRGLEPVRD